MKQWFIISVRSKPRAAMSDPRPSRRFCAAQFRFSL